MPNIKVIGDKEVISTLGNAFKAYNNEGETSPEAQLKMEYNEDKTCITFQSKNKTMLKEFAKNMTSIGTIETPVQKLDNKTFVFV